MLGRPRVEPKSNDTRKGTPRPRRAARLLVIVAAALVALPAGRAEGGTEDIVAVASRASSDYVRAKLPNGTFRPETYAFGQGGVWGGSRKDETIDKLTFMDVARTVAGPLAGQNFIPARDPNKANLLIMVYWGTTAAPEHASDSVAYQNLENAFNVLNAVPPPPPSQQGMAGSSNKGNMQASRAQTDQANSEIEMALTQTALENSRRDKVDLQNAAILGYDSEGLVGTDYGSGVKLTALRENRDDLITELEYDRYFVVLLAYDFQMVWKQKKHKLLWETRFSLMQRGHDFGRDLPSMAKYASRYFGQDSHGLVRDPLPEGRVDIGDLKTLGPEQEK
jgi:hypothetical protein